VTDYHELNRANWDQRAPLHARSPDYALHRFADDPGHLSGVVRFDRPRLGDLTGLCGIHLQCHLGSDTVSLSRLGARMTGLDFSGAALAEARQLAARVGADVDYLQADVYDAVEVAGAGAFDLVYTGIGALCWLPDIARWARVVAGLLRPGGRLFLREGHPVLWSLAEPGPEGRLEIAHPYFEQREPVVWDDPHTYAATDTLLTATLTHEWNHGLAETIAALMDAGLVLSAIEEHDSVPWDALPGVMSVDEHGEHRLTDRPGRLPCSYTLQAVKPG
jgi:SAM-dependent methyltransferase